MKFFTVNWWRGLEEDSGIDPVESYREHFRAIRDQLPPDLASLSENVSLHDSRLRTLRLDSPSQSLVITVDGSDRQGNLRRYQLEYRGLCSFESYADPDAGLAGPHGYGDWGYDESHLISGGLFEQRVLFSTGIEFRIQFREFSLAYED